VSKMEGRTNFSRHLKQFDVLTRLTLTPIFYDRSTPLYIMWRRDKPSAAVKLRNRQRAVLRMRAERGGRGPGPSTEKSGCPVPWRQNVVYHSRSLCSGCDGDATVYDCSATHTRRTTPPRAGSGVVRIDPLRFLAGCRTRRLNQV